MITYRSIYIHICICTHVSIHTNISVHCQLRGPRNNDVHVATSTHSTQILGSNAISQSFLEKWLILGWGRKYMINLENLLVPESKKVLKKEMGMCQRDISSQPKELPMSKAGIM